MAGITITSRSVFSCEVIDIVPTGERASVYVGQDWGSPRYVTRKLHRSADGRLFVAWQGGFAQVSDDGRGGYDLFLSGGRFVRGAWHRNEFNEFVEGPAAEPVRNAEATDGHGDGTPQEEPCDDDAEGGEFSLYEFFFGEDAD